MLDLKTRRDEIDEMPPPPVVIPKGNNTINPSGTTLLGGDWDVRLEYDPLWPNDYEKIIRERREKKERDREEDKRRDLEEREGHRSSSRRNRDRHDRPKELEARRAPEDEEPERERPRRSQNSGAAIAPPPSLAETVIEKKEPSSPRSFSGLIPTIGSSVAARIMAKYGFKEGQGLGKQEQGMSQALQVEKTSKRGGKIIHEKDIPKGMDFFIYGVFHKWKCLISKQVKSLKLKS